MKYLFSFRYMIVALVIVLFSALNVVPALADDGTPPAPDTSTMVVDTPPVVDAPPADSAPAAEESAPVNELLNQLPEGTDVVVVDQSGDPMPLASQEAAQAVATFDPMWCPAGAAPGAASCSKSYGSLEQLVNDFTDNAGDGLLTKFGGGTFSPTGNGVIWIQSGADPSGSAITIDGANIGFTQIVNSSLTLQGGWNGINGSAALDANDPYTTFVRQISITNWTGAVTINNLIVANVSVNSAADLTALNVDTNGAITLNNVKVQNNTNTGAGDMNGAVLSNTSSPTSAAVTIKNSSFDGNETAGVQVISKGAVIINNIAANGNGDSGAYINNTSASSDKTVTLTGLQQFNNNGFNGLIIHAAGAVSLANVTANHNSNIGVYIDNIDSSASAGVTIKGVNQFNNNSSSGLNVISHGTITLNSVTASYNTLGSGAQLVSDKNIIITGTNNFSGNQGVGLWVQSKGAISVNNVTAGWNSSHGVYLVNQFPGAVGGVTITGYGSFEHNGGYGAHIQSNGAITLNNINANKNGHGAYLDACSPDYTSTTQVTCALTGKNITLKGINNFNYNTGYGLEALSSGIFTASNLSANNNASGGGTTDYIIDPQGPTTIGGALIDGELGVTLTGMNTFNNNASNGLQLLSDKNITASNLAGSNNGVTAVYIRNDASTATPGTVTLTGTNLFNENTAIGLNILTYGAVTLNNITASHNAGGITVDNSTLAKPVTVNGFNNISNNTLYGFLIKSLGLVTLNNMTADKNANGNFIDNDNAPASAGSLGVTIKGDNSFSGSSVGTGLTITSNGAVSLNNISANDNFIYGLSVDNSSGILKSVTLTGVNNFNNNGGSGLVITASGAVTLGRSTANKNANTGINVLTPKTITLTCGSAYGNGNTGIYLHSTGGGMVTVKGAYASWNGFTNYSFTDPKNINYTCLLP